MQQLDIVDDSMRINVLGPLEVIKPGPARTLAQLDGRKPREILQYLVGAGGRVVEKNELARAIWPTAKPKNIDATIETYMSNLRRSIGSDLLDGRRVVWTTHRGYRLDEDLVEIDLVRFGQLTRRASLASAARIEVQLRLEAAQTAGGDLMPEVRSSWVEPLRDDYLVQRTTNLVCLADLQISMGAFAAAAVYAAAALELDPYLEEAVRTLLLAHYGDGHESTARTVYETFRNRLAADLHQDPTSATENIVAGIDAGERIETLVPGGIDGRRGGQNRIEVAPTPNRRRSAVMPFVGRSSELSAIQDCVDATRSGERRSVLVTGPSGSGKSELLNIIDDANETMVGRAWYPLDQPADFPCAAPLLDALARRDEKELGESYAGGQFLFADDAALRALADAITRSGPVVFMLDDFDRAPNLVVSTLRRLFEQYPDLGVSVVATARSGAESFDSDVRRFHYDRVISLGPLAIEDVRTLGPIGTELHSVCGGRPSSMSDLWRWRSGGNRGISPSKRAKILAELRQLAPTAGEVLTTLAQMAGPVSAESLAAAVEETVAEVNTELDVLERNGVITITSAGIGFAQPIVGTVLLEQRRGREPEASHHRS